MRTAQQPGRRERIRSMLADLKLPGALEAVDSILSGVDGGALTGAEAIERLLAAQVQLRNNRRLQAAMRSSRLPAVKTITDFDFSFQPSIKREQIESLHELGFVERKENVIFLGPPGVGKTHLAISLALAAAESGRRVYYGTLADLISSLKEAQISGRLAQRMKTLTWPAVLVVDEIGYLPGKPHRRHALLLCDSIQMALVYSRGAGRLTLSSSAVRGYRWTCRRPASLGASL